MVVKSIRGRRRYVVYSITKTITRNDILNILSEHYQKAIDIRAIVCRDGKVIIRCPPSEVTPITEIMVREFNCISIVTSGTLKTIYDLYPYLKIRKK